MRLATARAGSHRATRLETLVGSRLAARLRAEVDRHPYVVLDGQHRPASRRLHAEQAELERRVRVDVQVAATSLRTHVPAHPALEAVHGHEAVERELEASGRG